MTKASDNDYPSLLLTEQGSAPSSPAASHQRLYIRTSDHSLVTVNSSGTVAAVSGAAVDDSTISTSDITTNNASTSKHGWLKKLDNTSTHYMDGTGAWSTPAGSGGSLSYQQAKLSADVTMSSANTAYDGPTVTLSAGTWLIMGCLLILQPGSNGGVMDFKLWDGTTAIATTSITAPGAPIWVGPINLQAVVVIASGTPTYKMTAYHQSTGTKIVAAPGGGNATGNTASVITAVQIA